MICEKCKEAGLRSKVYIGMGYSTEAESPDEMFYDENGIFHWHSTVMAVSPYKCSNGHRWRIETRQQCQQNTCDFKHKKETIYEPGT